jgi:hypothetical protein
MNMFEARRGIKVGETMRLLHACTHRSDFFVKECNRKINRMLNDTILLILDTLDDADISDLPSSKNDQNASGSEPTE